jgi:hypothetical protein
MADAKIINYGQQISAGTTAIPDNQVALEIESTDAKDYITIDTTDGSEKITLSQATSVKGSFATTGGGTVGTGGSSDATLEQSGASTFQTALHVGAAIKIVDATSGAVTLRTVSSITDANTLEMDEAATIANGSSWYHDSGPKWLGGDDSWNQTGHLNVKHCYR